MKLLQRRKASGIHAALCSGVPRFSCAEAVVAQSIIASTAIQGRLVFEIMLVTPLIGLGFVGCVGGRNFSNAPGSQKAEQVA
jgi:hypothetical protein